MGATLLATGLRVERGSEGVLSGISLNAGDGTRLGVVGPNGVGKSTLLAVLSGGLRADAGRVELRPPHANVGLLAQERGAAVSGADPSETVREQLWRLTGASAAEAELEAAAGGLANGARVATERYAGALERFSALGVTTLEARLGAVLAELGLPERIADLPVTGLSGGQAARVGLAAILLSRFDVTLLDEPSNDLDFDGLARLEAYLCSLKGPLVLVSHDRALLDRVTTSVLELDGHDRQGHLYEGGWTSYLEERKLARRHAEQAHALYESERAVLFARARREREWARLLAVSCG